MRFSRVLRQAQKVLVKPGEGRPTGIAGILTHPNPRPALIAMYTATLKKLENMPAESVYRTSVENMTKSRLAIVQENDVVEVIENKIGNGLIEEVLLQANAEYDLIDKMIEWKVWEDLEEKPVEGQWEYFEKSHQ